MKKKVKFAAKSEVVVMSVGERTNVPRTLSTALLFIMQLSSSAEADTSEKKFGLDIGGRVMYDIDIFDGLYNADKNGNTGSESYLRQARINIKSKFDKQWQSELDVKVDDREESIKIKDAYILYSGWEFGELIFGKSKEPFGLENSTSSKNITTIERSSATNAFTPGRNYGIALSSTNRYQSWGVGIYNVDKNDKKRDKNIKNSHALTGRFTVTPFSRDDRQLLFGISGSYRNWSGAEYEIEQKVEVHTGDKIDYGKKIKAHNIRTYGLAFSHINSALMLQGEGFQQKVTVDDKQMDEDARYTGHYVQASYFLTGDSHRYNGGKLSRIEPQNERGAWEVVGRYSVLDGVDNGDGVKSNTSLFGLNYYANKKVRFMANLIRTELTGPDVENLISGNAISFRVQYVF